MPEADSLAAPSVGPSTRRHLPEAASRPTRSDRTRDAVLNAFLALVEQGDLSPTAERVAQRSQVSLRTVYHQFDDLETLHRLAGERVLRRVQQLTEPVETALSTEARVEAFVRQRVVVFDVLHPLSCAARLREPFSAVLRSNRDALLRLGEQQVRQAFAPELGELDPPAAGRLVVAISLVTNWSAWYALREELRQDREEAIAVMAASLHALVLPRRA